VSPKLNVRTVRARKRRDGAEPLVMVTAYDQPTAAIVSAAGVDLILVGDTVADNVLGYEDTLHVTIDDMEHHVAAVARAKPDCLIVGDMPWMSYHVSVEETVRNAARLIRAGAGCVKLEGGRKRVSAIEAIVNAEIPVMGHIGLTPQSVHAMGGMRVQGRDVDAASALIADATAIEAAGCFSMVVEAVPDAVGSAVTAALDVPTIGIGAGPGCDGQVLVFHDVLGLGTRRIAKFVRQYANLAEDATKALAAFASDVRTGAFPTEAESYESSEELRHAIGPAQRLE
jgi:3-methyl-2-oxobutanoate hydroxymethyltransferase